MAFGILTSLQAKRWTESHSKCLKVPCKSSKALKGIVTFLRNLDNLKSDSHLCINNLDFNLSLLISKIHLETQKHMITPFPLSPFTSDSIVKIKHLFFNLVDQQYKKKLLRLICRTWALNAKGIYKKNNGRKYLG